MEQRNDSGAATMKDVADAAGVSTATVSRTLMNPEKSLLTNSTKG